MLEANSLLFKGVESINQPLPLASSLMKIVPALGIPEASKLVIWASASCPVGKFDTSNLRSNGVEVWIESVQVGTVVFWR